MAVRNKLRVGFQDLGEHEVKNIAEPVRAYRLVVEGAAAGRRRPRRMTARQWVLSAATVVLVMLTATVAWDLYLTLFPAPPPTATPAAGPPGIAVLPFDNLSGDPAQDYFSDGITEDLITDLSQVSGLFVIARNSVFTYKGQAVKVQQVGRELGVQYVLEGSVRKSGNRVRINAQLVDTATGRHLWADRYDREITDVFALQDEVTQKIVSALAVKLTAGEEEKLSQAERVHPEAYDMLLRGLERFRRFTRETNADAREFFERAIAIDPSFARAHADVALTHAMDIELGWTDAPDRSLQQAKEMIEHALSLDDSLPQVHFALTNVYRQEKRHDDAIAAARRAIQLEPSYADGYATMALSLNYAGQAQVGLDAIRTAMRLNPRHPFFYVWIVGQSHFLMGAYDDAIAQFEDVIASNPHFPSGHLALAAAYAQAGRMDEAEWEAAEVISLLPDFSLARERERSLYTNAADRDRWIEGLRKAGLPE
jgi:adenylate cyclase